jgi:uncharacterized protein
VPITPTYPGIYIQEASSSTHTITAAQTNIAVFIGYTHPLKTIPANFGKAVPIGSFQDYQRQFGGFLRSVAFANAIDPTALFSPTPTPDTSFGDLAQAVNQFFLNGGMQAYVVALQSQYLNSLSSTPPSDPTIPPGTLSGAKSTHTGPLTFWAREITDETYQLTVQVTAANPPPSSPPPSPTADIVITYGPKAPANTTEAPRGTIVETYRQVKTVMGPNDPNYITKRINGVSALVWVTVAPGSPPPTLATENETLDLWLSGTDWSQISEPTDFTDQLQADTDLDKQPVLNLMVLPGVTNTFVLSTAQAFCERKYVFLVMDPPLNAEADTIQMTLPTSANAALYFPYLKSPNPFTGLSTDPLTQKVYEIPPAATVAGIMARTDGSRGVWKAPAGFQATVLNTTGVVDRGRMTDLRQGQLNPVGINCLRDFPNIGTVVYGARTTVTMTDEQSRYVPVRRMTLFLEQTLYANLGWVVFEPNDEPLWSAITMSINAFMLGLFRQGAFQGDTPSKAFSVLCNDQTTTQTDIDSGIVNIVVAFAPLKPAEFVIITLAQIAGQTATS